MDEDEVIRLGGNIELKGFDDVDRQNMMILKKIIGNHVKELTNTSANYQKLEMCLRNCDGGCFSLDATLVCDETMTATHEHPNLLMAVDGLIKKLYNGDSS
jgi:hypothetical protein